MSDVSISTRRSSYGPTSPQIGSRGARTRSSILEAGLASFVERGYHASSVEDIANHAGVSRATLYQYFQNKEEVFLELMRRSGAHLTQLVKGLTYLGPDAEGYGCLHQWLGEWTWIFERYAPMFIEWTNIDTPLGPVRTSVDWFVEFHAEKVGRVIADGGYSGADPKAAALLCLSLSKRLNYIRHVYRLSYDDERILLNLTNALQLFLFPETPTEVLEAGPTVRFNASETHPWSQFTPYQKVAWPTAPSVPPMNTGPSHSPYAAIDSIGTVALETFGRLLAAARVVFASNGYEATNIDLIVSEAGVARSTFYRYFSDKVSVMRALSQEVADQIVPMFEQYPDVVDSVALDDWFRSSTELQRRYSGVVRAWTERTPDDAHVLGHSRQAVEAMSHGLTTTFGPKRDFVLDRGAAGIMFAAVLEAFSNEGIGSKVEPSLDMVVECQARFARNVLRPRR